MRPLLVAVGLVCLLGGCSAPTSEDEAEGSSDAISADDKDAPSLLKDLRLKLREPLSLPAPGAQRSGLITNASWVSSAGVEGQVECGLRSGKNVPAETTLSTYAFLSVSDVDVKWSGLVVLRTVTWVRSNEPAKFGIAADKSIDVLIECKATAGGRTLPLTASELTDLLSTQFELSRIRTPSAIIGVRG